MSTPAGPVALRVVHPLAPFPSYWHEYKTALADIGQSVRASGDSTMAKAHPTSRLAQRIWQLPANAQLG